MSDTTNLMGGSPQYQQYQPQPQQQYQQQPQLPQQQQYQQQQQPSQKVPNIDHFLSSMQGAIASGATQLPSRDIPTEQYPPPQLDPEVQVNYADNTLLNDSSGLVAGGRATSSMRQQYIDHDDDDDTDKPTSTNSFHLEELYNTLQIPIILAVLFFLFQLPVIKKYEFNYAPFAFTGDGNWNVSGIVLNSIAFSAIYYVLQKILKF